MRWHGNERFGRIDAGSEYVDHGMDLSLAAGNCGEARDATS